MTELSPAVVAGAIAGAVALVVFTVIHALWIAPIWAILMFLPIAALVGALAAWPFEEIAARGALPPAPLDGLAFIALLLATLVPTAVAGMVTGAVDRNAIRASAVLLPLLLAAPTGLAIGAVLAGSERGAIALAIAALALALTLGHNLPFFPIGSAAWEKAFSLVIVVELAAGVAFSATRALLSVAVARG